MNALKAIALAAALFSQSGCETNIKTCNEGMETIRLPKCKEVITIASKNL